MCDNHHTHDNSPHKGIEHDGHDLEHKKWSRRSFIQALGIAGSGSMFLGSHMISASSPSPLTAAVAAADGYGIQNKELSVLSMAIAHHFALLQNTKIYETN